MTPRAKALIGSALTVVVLAVVFFVGWSVSSSRTPKPSVPQTITLSPAQQSQDAYQKGMSALSSEETSTAVALFRTAVKLDSTNTAAKQQLDTLTKATTSSSSSTANGSSTSGTGKAPSTATVLCAMVLRYHSRCSGTP